MRLKRWLGLIGLVVLLLGFVAGCGEAPENAGGNEDETEVASIMVKGSDSEVNLVTMLAEEYMDEHPNVIISVTGGGSGVGITALIDGDTDIANSSRVMKDAEKDEVKARHGVDAFAVRFAVDGVAVIVHADNPLEEITVDDLGKIYRGEITNWSGVGGDDREITLYGRQSTSGTYSFFMESVLKGEYSPQMRNLGGNADIVEAVKTDFTGVGYVAIGYAAEDGQAVPGLKALKVAASAGAEAFNPIELANITSGNYPLTRPLYQYVVGKPAGAMLDFLKFEVSAAGEAIVLGEGFYPITDDDKTFNKTALE